MMRAAASLVVLVVVMGLVEPVAAHQRAPEESTGATCPMMAHRPATTPCIGEPCPCHHSSNGLLLPNNEGVGVPEEASALAAPGMPWASTALTDARCATGFLSLVYRPPDPSI